MTGRYGKEGYVEADTVLHGASYDEGRGCSGYFWPGVVALLLGIGVYACDAVPVREMAPGGDEGYVTVVERAGEEVYDELYDPSE